MKKIYFPFFLFLIQTAFAQKNFTQYVNPFAGTGGHGHTFPGATMPFGMVQLSPDTRIDGSWDGCSGYHYSDSIIYGFSHTHLSGTGASDYGDILLMPTVGEPVLSAMVNGDYKKGYASHFLHQKENASPGYYSVHLDDDNIEAEFTASYRVGFHKYTFPKSSQANIILDLTHRDKVIESSIRVTDLRHVEGMRRSKAWAQNQVVYFAIEFSKQFDNYGISLDDSVIGNQSLSLATEHSAKNIKSFFQFTTGNGEAIYVKIGLSSVSMEGARNNLERELPGWDFEQARINTEATWNYMLSRIEASGGTATQKRVFYTALYHCMIAPNIYNDIDGSYRGRDMQVHKANLFNYYTVFSLWDTFRGLHPLFTIIAPRQETDFMKTFLAQYEQGHRLPVWELSSNETDCMIGYHAVSVMADAAVKGITGFDYKQALYAMETSAAADQRGLNAYREQGYISMEDESESVSKTLEYSYDDWCISQVAKLVGETSAQKEFSERGQYWKNIFDASTGFMRPKKNGNFISPFNPYEVNFNYTEANAWQYRFFVPQDIDGLINMIGGKEKFDAALDSLFNVSSATAGREQPDISGLIGQYAHGNEPSHHMAYLYDYAGKPWKTQQLVRRIMNEFYHDAPDGLIGNEDCGQLSAWYVLSAMGFYSVTPGTPYYAIGAPLFDTIRIHQDNQKTFTIIAANNGDDKNYIQSMEIDGAPTDTFYFSQSMILSGKTVTFRMSDKASMQQKGITAPPSSMKPTLIIDPLIIAPSATFHSSVAVTLKPVAKTSKIFYSTNGEIPGSQSAYSKPLTLHASTTVKARAVNEKGESSKTVTAKFLQRDKDWQVNYVKKYNSLYDGGDEYALVDGIKGNEDFHNGQWQGWWGDDMEVIIDLESKQTVSAVSAEFLQDEKSWIMMPLKVDFEASADGINFIPVATAANDISDTETGSILKSFSVSFHPQAVRYIKVKAVNYGTLPQWHQGAGGKAWIFCDEINIQ